MYGFETSVLLPMANGHALCAERPFYPADIAAALEAVPRPRLLVSTPVHLRALLASGIALPRVDLIVSATAPLAQQLAAEAEARFDTQLLEIYGSTETGQIAVRRPTHTAEWRLWPGVTLSLEGESTLGAGRPHRTAHAPVRRAGGDRRGTLPAAWPGDRSRQHRRQAQLA